MRGAYCLAIMETQTQTNPGKNPELILPLGATALLAEANSEQILLFNKPQAAEPQPTWALASLFFIIELP